MHIELSFAISFYLDWWHCWCIFPLGVFSRVAPPQLLKYRPFSCQQWSHDLPSWVAGQHILAATATKLCYRRSSGHLGDLFNHAYTGAQLLDAHCRFCELFMCHCVTEGCLISQSTHPIRKAPLLTLAAKHILYSLFYSITVVLCTLH